MIHNRLTFSGVRWVQALKGPVTPNNWNEVQAMMDSQAFIDRSLGAAKATPVYVVRPRMECPPDVCILRTNQLPKKTGMEMLMVTTDTKGNEADELESLKGTPEEATFLQGLYARAKQAAEQARK